MTKIELNKFLLESQFSGIANVIEKANKLKDNVIRLEVGDVDLDPSKLVMEGISEALNNKKTHYPALKGESILIDEIVRSLKKENISISNDQILITSGGSMGMYLALQSLINYNDEVLIFEPVWPHLVQMIILAGGKPIKIPLDETNNFHLNIDKLKEAVSDRTKAIIINTPNNPTGIVYNEDEIKKLCEFADIHNLVIISDEEYCNFVYGNNKVISPISYYDKTIVSRSFSKTFSISGLRLGYIIAPSEWIKAITKWSLFSTMYSPSITQFGIADALRQNDLFPEQSRKIYEDRMNFVVENINKIKGIKCQHSEGSVYAWIKFTDSEADDQKICDTLLYDAKVALVPGRCFGESGKGYARLSLGQNIQQLEEAINRMRRII